MQYALELTTQRKEIADNVRACCMVVTSYLYLLTNGVISQAFVIVKQCPDQKYVH